MLLVFLVSKFWICDFTVLYMNGHPALQGAFVEHRSALESLPYHEQFEILLVKTVEDLNRCDALIIPGGGKRITCIYSCRLDHPLNREYNHRAISKNIWSP